VDDNKCMEHNEKHQIFIQSFLCSSQEELWSCCRLLWVILRVLINHTTKITVISVMSYFDIVWYYKNPILLKYHIFLLWDNIKYHIFKLVTLQKLNYLYNIASSKMYNFNNFYLKTYWNLFLNILYFLNSFNKRI